jgi:glycerol transport system permease protein
MKEKNNKLKARYIFLIAYFILLFIPIYWMLITSFKTDVEILSSMTFFPKEFTFKNYVEIFTSPTWMNSFKNSLIYVVINVILVLLVSIPGAYAFSRYNFLGDKHLFFWLLTNRMAPAAIFIVPFTELFYTLHIHDTHLAVALGHSLFNIPLAIWILEGFMSGIPKEIDETAFVDGYSFPHFFRKIFFPLVAPGIGVTAFFSFTFSWVELIIAKAATITEAKPVVVTLTVGIGAEGVKWGLLSAAGVLTIIPGAIVVYFVRNYMAKGFALGRV